MAHSWHWSKKPPECQALLCSSRGPTSLHQTCGVLCLHPHVSASLPTPVKGRFSRHRLLRATGMSGRFSSPTEPTPLPGCADRASGSLPPHGRSFALLTNYTHRCQIPLMRLSRITLLPISTSAVRSPSTMSRSVSLSKICPAHLAW
jgi:hypothetical protein